MTQKNPKIFLKKIKKIQEVQKKVKIKKPQEPKNSKNHFFSKNLKLWKSIFSAKKILFVSQYQDYAILPFFFSPNHAILLVFQYQENAIRPELSSPARFRFQGGWGSTSVMDGRMNEQLDRRTEILLSYIGYSTERFIN